MGSANFFDDNYIKKVRAKYPQKSYGSDFLIGIVHFILFFAWAVTIDVHPKTAVNPSVAAEAVSTSVSTIPLGLFPVILGFILIYDAVWYLACREYDTRRFIKRWMIINLATFVIGALTYGFVYFALSQWQLSPTRRTLCAEAGAFVWVFIVSGIDLAENVLDRRYFRKWLSGILTEEELS